MNAIATTGSNQANLLATFPFPAANAAPATPAFVNMFSLMLSSPNQTAPQITSYSDPAAKGAETPWAISASPAQIADAMIRSMLGSPLGSPVTAVPVSTDPSAGNAAAPAPTSSTNTNSNQTPQASRKQAPNPPGVVLPNIQATVPVQVIVAPAPPAPTTPAGDSQTSMAKATTPQPVASAPAAPLARNSSEAKIAFTALLTPIKDAPQVSVADSPTAAGAGNPSPAVPASAPQPVANPMQPAAATNSQATGQGATMQASITQANGDQQAGGDTPPKQGSDSPETPARPTAPAPEKIKPIAQQDDNSQQAAGIAAVHDRSFAIPSVASPADSARTDAPTQSSAAPAVTPYNATAEALRTTESNLTAAPSRTGVAQEISIRIAPPDSPAVDLRVVERAGQVHVDVRTPDSAMQSSLRQDLGTLTNSLERAGYHTETFTPSSALARAAFSAQTGQQDGNQDPSQNRGGSGDFSGGRRQQQQQKRPDTWLEEFEEQS